MARPKRIEGEPSALERMEGAFWELLAQTPFEKMTCKELRARAGVSHNTFYYHFESMEDMAARMFKRMAVPQVPVALMAVMAGDQGTVAAMTDALPDFPVRFQRMRLLAGSGSPFLIGLLQEAVLGAWMAAVGVTEADLSSDDQADLAFAFGGFISLLGSDVAQDPAAITSFTRRELGQGLLGTMRRIAAKKPGVEPSA